MPLDWILAIGLICQPCGKASPCLTTPFVGPRVVLESLPARQGLKTQARPLGTQIAQIRQNARLPHCVGVRVWIAGRPASIHAVGPWPVQGLYEVNP